MVKYKIIIRDWGSIAQGTAMCICGITFAYISLTANNILSTALWAGIATLLVAFGLIIIAVHDKYETVLTARKLN